jgi:hypothetical protein
MSPSHRRLDWLQKAQFTDCYDVKNAFQKVHDPTAQRYSLAADRDARSCLEMHTKAWTHILQWLHM